MKIFDKPPGTTTHSSLAPQDQHNLLIDPVDGFLEYLTSKSSVKLWPIHRLDVETSGVCIAAESSIEAAEWSRLFETREIEKVYYFVTDRKPPSLESKIHRVESHIERRSQSNTSRPSRGPSSSTLYTSIPPSETNPLNAITVLERVQSVGQYSLWRAQPETGKPHQIRLHAQSLGIPILGDQEHGGTPFPTLCLHAEKLAKKVRNGADRENISLDEFTSPLPRWFADMTLLQTPVLVRWLQAYEKRERLFRSLAAVGVRIPETIRWVHTDGGQLRVDQLGDVFQIHCYVDAETSEFPPTERALIDRWIQIVGLKNWYLQLRGNRGREPNAEKTVLSRSDLPLRWTTSENAMKLEMRRDSGLSAGLFLDQRENRNFVYRNSSGKRVLNLFAYTGAFSLASAVGGASKVITVDVSKNFLAWAQRNFELNELSITDSRFEFRAIETEAYLRWALKKDLKFDLIICDPPSFARTKSGVFRLESELENLILGCLRLLTEQGSLLFTTNFEGLSAEDLLRRLKSLVDPMSRRKIDRLPSPDWDFEFPRESRMLKGFLIGPTT